MNPIINGAGKSIWHFGLESPVVIKEKGFRSNSRSFSEDITCPEIVHELLHHTGLVDEYVEHEPSKDGKTRLFNCRIVGPENSVMRNHENIRGGFAYKIHAKLCPRTQECRKFSVDVMTCKPTVRLGPNSRAISRRK